MSEWTSVLLADPQYPIATLVGVFFLGYPLYAGWEAARRRRRRTGRARGEVVGEELNRSFAHGVEVGQRGVSTRHPVVVFEANGSRHRLVSETGASWETLSLGQIVDVHYNPRNPEDAGVENASLEQVETMLLWLIPLIGAGMVLWGVFHLLR